MSIQEGFGIIPGRGRDNARAALAAAEALGLPATVVRTQADGYLVPNAVLDKYEESKFEAEPESDGADGHDKTDGDESDQTKADETDKTADADEPKGEDESKDEAKPTKKPAAKSAAAKK